MDQLRTMSYKELNEAMALISFILMFVSGGMLLIITLPIWLLLLALKFGVDVYDSNQEKLLLSEKWTELKNTIICLTGNEYFDALMGLLNEIDFSKKPVRFGSQAKWDYLNSKPKTALNVYSAIAAFDENDIDPAKQKIKMLAVIGLSKIEDSYQHIFQMFERTTDKRTRSQLAKTLLAMSHVAPTRMLLIFSDYVQKDYSWHKEELIRAIIQRAQDFNQEEINKILLLARYGDAEKFYLQRARYFFGNAYDYSSSSFNEDATVWLEKFVRDFAQENNYSDTSFDRFKLNEESGVLLAIAYRELGNYKGALSVLEYVLWKEPDYLPAIIQIVDVCEALGDYEKAKEYLVKSRTYVSSDVWVQKKLREYSLA